MSSSDEILKKINKVTHGRSDDSIYHIWEGILQRCNNPKNPSYPRYGGRGITVCPRWHAFENFLKDMGERPEGKSIERENTDGNYEPSNCKWATRVEQNNNMTNNVHLTFQGKTQTASQWAKEKGMRVNTLYLRLDKLGWSVEEALTTPVTKKGVPHTVNGESMTLNQWAKKLGITISTMYTQMKENPLYLHTLVTGKGKLQ